MSIWLAGALRCYNLPIAHRVQHGFTTQAVSYGDKFFEPVEVPSYPRKRQTSSCKYGNVSSKPLFQIRHTGWKGDTSGDCHERPCRQSFPLTKSKKLWHLLRKGNANSTRHIAVRVSRHPWRGFSDPRFPTWAFSASRWTRIRALRMLAVSRNTKMNAPAISSGIEKRRSLWERSEVMPDRLFIREPIVFTKPCSSGSSSFKLPREHFHPGWFLGFNFVAARRCSRQVPGNFPLPSYSHLHIEPNARRTLIRTSKWDADTQYSPMARRYKLGPRKRRRNWKYGLLSALDTDFNLAIKMVSNLMLKQSKSAPQYAIADSIALICHVLLGPYKLDSTVNSSERGPQISKACCSLAHQYLNRFPGASYNQSFTPYILELFVVHADVTQLSAWAHDTIQNSFQVSPDLVQKMALRAIELDEISLAMELQENLPQEAFASKKMATACTKMLAMETTSQQSYSHRMQMLTLMLERGVKPDHQLRDAIVQFAMTGRDLNLAWQTHRQAIENGILPTVQTYSYLLEGLKESDNLSIVFSVIRESERQGLVYRSVRLGNAIIRTLYRILMARSAPQRYDTLLDVYTRIFNTKPLYEIGIIHRSPQAHSRKLSPNRIVLQRMLSAWISECHDPQQLEALYERWIKLNKVGSSRIALTAGTSGVFRAFMVQFSSIGAKSLSFRVLRDLRQDDLMGYTSLSGAMAEKLREAGVVRDARQRFNVESYTALVHSFASNGEMREAEEVVRIMQDHGTKVDAILYEVLLLGHAKVQDIAGLIRVLMQKRNAGFELDEWTMRAMGKIENREALREALLAAKIIPAQ